MGAGRGRCAFWLSEFVGCRVCAVEWIPLFHNISLFISKIFRFKGLTLVKDDMFNMDFQNFDIIFLYGTCLEDDEIYLLIEKLKKAGKKVKIITISYPLSAYDPSYSTIIHFPVLFPWGTADCYLNQRTSC
jgi:hypothetical protein